MHRGLRYWPNCGENWRFGLPSQNLSHFDTLLGLRGILFKTNFCVETLSSSQLFWVWWSLWMQQIFCWPIMGQAEHANKNYALKDETWNNIIHEESIEFVRWQSGDIGSGVQIIVSICQHKGALKCKILVWNISVMSNLRYYQIDSDINFCKIISNLYLQPPYQSKLNWTISNVYWLLWTYRRWCLVRPPLWEYCLPHCPQVYLTPSCTAFWCLARFIFLENWLPHWPQG